MPSIFNTVKSTNKSSVDRMSFANIPFCSQQVSCLSIYIAAYNDQNDKSPLSKVFMQKYD